MYIKQISVFLENKPGTLEESLRILKETDVNILALSLADTSEFGLLRIIVDKPEAAREALKKKGYTSVQNDVLMLHLKERVGFLQELIEAVAKAGINVEYMYAAPTSGEGADLVIKTSDPEGAAKAIAAVDADALEVPLKKA